MEHVSLKADGETLSQGNGVAKMILANIPMYREENWQVSKIVSWHNLEGHSIQWFCIVCIDRRGMMADVTTALAAAEIDRGQGMGVMLFHVEVSLDSLVSVCQGWIAFLVFWDGPWVAAGQSQ
ncbi:GTP diphosphokinase RSH1, chloroplastic [Olea europaea subsp. europaea]|uniref:GTP diphosphokinase RSH1, chloroplastic n=1 Tax=Olea europaea subsp. europaea TaxID=158383 RepID=A0A8S0SAT4_OLEEU|nr:GTP diphosphokinase RSH1, chloroplastic [Olea europaea subsp. europaea]